MKKKTPDTAACVTCRFWKEDHTPGHEGRAGECRSRPPAVLYDGETIFCTWPQTDARDWCGDHERVMQ